MIYKEYNLPRNARVSQRKGFLNDEYLVRIVLREDERVLCGNSATSLNGLINFTDVNQIAFFDFIGVVNGVRVWSCDKFNGTIEVV